MSGKGNEEASGYSLYPEARKQAQTPKGRCNFDTKALQMKGVSGVKKVHVTSFPDMAEQPLLFDCADLVAWVADLEAKRVV